MIFDDLEKHPGARVLLILASLVIVVAGLRAASAILVPFFLALFLAIVSMPVMFWLRRKRVPAPLAIFLTVFVDVLLFGFLILLASNSVGSLQARLPRYQNEVAKLRDDGIGWMVDHGMPREYLTTDLLDPGALFDFVGGTLQTVASLFGVGFLVAIIMIFVLAEATVFPFKFQAILGHSRQGRMRITNTIQEIQVYLGIKTLVSLATGLTAGLFCWIMGLDFPVLLGLTAFVLNYVPTIGSIIASIPAMVLALILQGPGTMIVIGAGYLVINTVFGSVIEPNLLGRRLGLSTLVVVLSLLFWGWLWGPVGALLSVPLTMVLKIVLENTPDMRWVAVLLDKVPPQARRGAASSPNLREALGLATGLGAAASAPGEETSPSSQETDVGSEPEASQAVG